MIAGAAFALATGTAAVRLILYTAEPPLALRDLVAWEVASVHPLGIPLVVMALGAAIVIVLTAKNIAVNRLDDLIRNGP
jgi:hypothetical protein